LRTTTVFIKRLVSSDAFPMLIEAMNPDWRNISES
jgi:hypothetical protein